MKRRTFDVIASAIGLGIAALLIVAGGLLTWAHSFAHGQVRDQLVAQQIFFPDKSSDSLKELKGADFTAIDKYAGQELATGEQAKAYADHYIGVHLQAIGGGKTYSQLSAEAMQDPTNEDLQATVATVFKGTTLRSMLLNAYAWDKTATLAGDGALVAWVGAGVFAVLGGLGLWHSRRVPPATELLTGEHESITPTNA
ncbi:MAG TPA: hypothetical protein VE442_06650 [Jatrophihabitans sp.]|jgi:hypothetical protein|nr:hypothetical protein [Jatrophihabitans sp.]